MAHLLAIDWDRHEARYVLASAARDKVRILAAASVAMARGAEGEEPQADPAAALGEALAGRRFRGAKTLVAVGRASVEMLLLTLPPAQDAELPDMVLNQAMRESQNIGEDSALDFLPLNENPREPRRVVALALAPEELKRVRAACAAVGIRPERILFRPYAAAALFLRAGLAAKTPCLLVNRVAEEVDLTVLIDGKAAFSRTVRTPPGTDEEAISQRLLGEVSRTLTIAAQDHPAAETIGNVYLFGSPGDHRELIEKIETELSLRAEVFDPFQAVAVSPHEIPEHAGRFASLLGMIFDQAHGESHAVDFLHPRKKPQPPDRRWKFAALAALVVAAVAMGGYYLYGEIAALDAQNAQLQKRLADLNGLVAKVARQNQLVAALRAWEGREVNWLDELRDLARRFPSGRDMLLLRMTLSPGRTIGGAIDFNGVVRDNEVVVNMERNIRDAFHEIQSRRVQESPREKDYTWQFEASIFARPRTRAQYAVILPQAAPATATSAPGAGAPSAAAQAASGTPMAGPKQLPSPRAPTPLSQEVRLQTVPAEGRFQIGPSGGRLQTGSAGQGRQP
jgi:Tfp pilus assembly protein PilN